MDLDGQHTWFNCDDFDLPTYKSISCNTESSINNSLAEDILFVESMNGISVRSTYKSPKPFPISCSDLLRNLASGTEGMIGLVNTTTSLHAQMSTQFNLPHTFALCLPSTSGPAPYYKNIAKKLITTKLVSYPVDTDKIYTITDPYDEYFIDLKSITIDQKLVPLDASLLSINKDGFGGTTFSTKSPFYKFTNFPLYGLYCYFVVYDDQAYSTTLDIVLCNEVKHRIR
ncbi:hypothetical protein POM88_038035 [Heracleum sosnowskyi]|uniref:Peptidase A1 domain-containing protein n=1 Tax=Heracleum sosnowskyi TaxID=360622 RepID=A0AAD8MHB1_9APIA|nr:hypothetical protein POM88_038035 [Heracleum sosnowskyi]